MKILSLDEILQTVGVLSVVASLIFVGLENPADLVFFFFFFFF